MPETDRPQARRDYPQLMDHETFQATPGYADLCAQFGLDPARPWEDQTLPLAEAAEFFEVYEATRARLAAWTPELLAAHYEGLTLCHQGDDNAPVWLARYGKVLIVQDPQGQCWTLTAEHATPQTAADALTAAAADNTPPN